MEDEDSSGDDSEVAGVDDGGDAESERAASVDLGSSEDEQPAQ